MMMMMMKRDKKQLTSIKMEFFRRRDGYPLFDRKMKEEMLEELKVEPAVEKLRRYKSKWLQHLKRMSSNRMPKMMLKYGRPNGRRRFGRPLKRVVDEAETGLSGPNL